MGKKNFPAIYVEATKELGGRPTMKVSHFADKYDASKNYAGVIVYHNEGSFRWFNKSGIAKGYKGRAFYVIFQCTDYWPDQAFRRAGEGKVHDYLYRLLFDNDFSEKKTCCGGFAVMQGKLKYSSIWLNMQSSNQYRHKWASDGSKMLSDGERLLVDLVFNRWKVNGTGKVIDIPDSVDSAMKIMHLNDQLSFLVPPSEKGFEVGDRVRVRSTITTPKYNWGSLESNRGEWGIVTKVSKSDAKVWSEFPSALNWVADASELERVRVNFKIGSIVRLRSSVSTPKHGLGSLDRNEQGKVTKIINDEKLIVDFPSYGGWAAHAPEMHIIIH